jgi:enoyl-CoA hydratase
MAFENILVEKTGAVAVIRLNRPKAMNALNGQLMAELALALAELEADEGVRCLVLTGNDKAFAAGADIKEMKDRSFMDVYKGDFITSTWEQVT